MQPRIATKLVTRMLILSILFVASFSFLAPTASAYRSKLERRIKLDGNGNPVKNDHGRVVYEIVETTEITGKQIAAAGAAIGGIIIIFVRCHSDVFMNVQPPPGWTFQTDGLTFLRLTPPAPITQPTTFVFRYETIETNPNTFQIAVVGVGGAISESGPQGLFSTIEQNFPKVEILPMLSEVQVGQSTSVTVAVRNPDDTPIADVPVDLRVAFTDLSFASRQPAVVRTDQFGFARFTITGLQRGYAKLHAISSVPGLETQISSGIVFIRD